MYYKAKEPKMPKIPKLKSYREIPGIRDNLEVEGTWFTYRLQADSSFRRKIILTGAAIAIAAYVAFHYISCSDIKKFLSSNDSIDNRTEQIYTSNTLEKKL